MASTAQRGTAGIEHLGREERREGERGAAVSRCCSGHLPVGVRAGAVRPCCGAGAALLAESASEMQQPAARFALRVGMERRKALASRQL